MKYNSVFDIEESKKKPTLKLWQKNLIILAAMALALNLLAVIYVNLCRDIYYWSNADYWNVARRIASGEFDGRLWSTVYRSIIQSEFNYIPSLLPAVFIRIFGESRMVFILSLVNCYLLPSEILIYLLAKRIGKAPIITLLLVIFTLPLTIYLTFNGFTEIGGFVICLGCFYLYFGKNGRDARLWRYIAIGLLLTGLMLWNNWFLFFSVSFITAMFADSLILRERKWYMSLISLVTMLVSAAYFFNGFMFQRLIAAYGGGDLQIHLFADMKLITRYLGLLFLLLLAVNSVIISVKNKERRTLFIWVQLSVCCLTFGFTQRHGQGHFLLYVPGLITLMILSIKYIDKESMLIGVFLLALLHSVNIFIPRAQPNGIDEIKDYALIPNFSMRPTHRDSAYDILTLKTTLDNIIPDGEYLGVLSYSDVLNSEMLKNAEPSLNVKQTRLGYIANTIPYFDLPEMDFSPLLKVNYMLVAFPAQVIRDDQKIIASAVDSFANWTDIATAFEEMYEYETITDNTQIKLFRRVRDVTRLEEAQFINKYRTLLNQ